MSRRPAFRWAICGPRWPPPGGTGRKQATSGLHHTNARPVDRQHVAGCRWPTGSDQRAAGNLRSALWRLKCAGINVIESDKCSLTLRNGTVVDIRVLSEWAARLIDGSAAQSDLCPVFWPADAMDLLPGWYDDWIIFERERIRHRLLHALEALSRRLIEAGRCAEAVDAAISAVGVDPLRESATRILIEAHLAEGNLVEGHRAYERYRDTVRRAARRRAEPGSRPIWCVPRSARSVRFPGAAPQGRPGNLPLPKAGLKASGCSGSRNLTF